MLKKYIAKVVERENLSTAEAEDAMEIIMEGKSSDSQIASFITALRMKKESVEEITGFAKTMRKKSEHTNTGNIDLLDTCGTGGDGSNTFNVSTVSAFVVAGAGIKVAKHGNRSVSSKCGSADLLAELGVKIDIGPDDVMSCLEQTGIGFLFAPVFHKAMKYAAVPRRSIGIRTIFNMLGPLTNPMGARYQLVGVFSSDIVVPMAEVLGKLGAKHAFVVHGEDGVDEVSLCSETKVAEYKDGEVREFTLEPSDFGFEACNISELQGGDAKENAIIARNILGGKNKDDPMRKIVLVNAAIALITRNCADKIKEALAMATESIDSGEAMKKLEAMINFTNSIS